MSARRTGSPVAPPAANRRLEGRLIGLGVTGSIAAYKAVELLRLLTAEGADVVVLLSPSAARFVGPLSFGALSRHPVETDVLDLLGDGRIGHIVVADSADAIVVAPATAHFLGAMANGMASDTVIATCLATSAPVIVAPAMDGDMWAHPATAANVARLREAFGYVVVSPESGPLASGQTGPGRLAELPRIVDAVVGAVAGRPIRQPTAADRPPLVAGPPREADLSGRRIVVTAGGTREPIDPVRFSGNRSSGKMGLAVAEAALARGARVTLVAAAVEVPLPEDPGCEVVRVETTADLEAALRDTLFGTAGGSSVDVSSVDALVMAAAVSDFRPARTAATKLARGAGLTLALSPTPDLLAGVAARLAATPGAGRPVLVGFAAETGALDRAGAKLRAKGVDLLVANDVAEPGSGFGSDTNRVTLLDAAGGRDDLPLLPKREVADRILDRVARLLDDRDAGVQTGPARQPAGQRPSGQPRSHEPVPASRGRSER